MESELIEIHTHILPGVDDGAADIGITRKMLTLAYEQGIRKIIATPHFQAGRLLDRKLVEEAFFKTQEEIERLGLALTLYKGNELFYSEGCLEAVKEGKAATLAGSRYILLEFYEAVSYRILYQGISQFIRAGYLPILAHMERYAVLFKEEKYIRELMELGCYFQMNADSLLGGWLNHHSAWCRKLVQDGIIHFISSDCHNADTRPPQLRQYCHRMERKMEVDEVRKLVSVNPSYILEDRCL